MTYTVTLSNPASGPITVAYNASGTATSGADFGASSGTLTFAPNVISQTFTVAITNDTTFEGAENYTANLSAPTGGATIATGTVTTTINDDGTGGPPGTDNDTPALSIADISVGRRQRRLYREPVQPQHQRRGIHTKLGQWHCHTGYRYCRRRHSGVQQRHRPSPRVDCCERQCDHPAGATSVQLRLATTDDVISGRQRDLHTHRHSGLRRHYGCRHRHGHHYR
ncbi:MAG: hypothetical protein IPG23_05440 [Burkholderiales bacterium]|nr:hypothetical protein [Burkholderiales bacterium]